MGFRCTVALPLMSPLLDRIRGYRGPLRWPGTCHCRTWAGTVLWCNSCRPQRRPKWRGECAPRPSFYRFPATHSIATYRWWIMRYYSNLSAHLLCRVVQFFHLIAHISMVAKRTHCSVNYWNGRESVVLNHFPPDLTGGNFLFKLEIYRTSATHRQHRQQCLVRSPQCQCWSKKEGCNTSDHYFNRCKNSTWHVF